MDYSFMPLNLISVVSTQFFFAYAVTRLLDIDHPVWFVIAETLLITTAIPMRAFDLIIGSMYGFIITLMPIVWARDPLTRRVFVTVCCIMILIVTEMPTSIIWNMMTGLPLSDYRLILDHLGEYVFVSILHVLIMMLLYAILEIVLNRFVGKTTETSVKLFLWFPLVQLVLMFVFQWVLVEILVQSWEVVWYGAAAAFVCVVIDIVMFILFVWFSRKEEDEKRAAAMRDQLERYLGEYESIAATLENTAKMRHDLRNQIQIVYILIERGRYQEASDHLSEMHTIIQATDCEG